MRRTSLVVALLGTVGLFAWASLGAFADYRACDSAIAAAADLQRIEEQVHDLQHQRGLAVLNGRGQDFARYSNRIAELNNSRPDPSHAALRDGFRTLEASNEIKEATAQERGILAGVFVAGALEPGKFERFTAARANRETGIADFDRTATEAQRIELYAALASPAAVEAARYEQIVAAANSAGDGRGPLSTPVDPEAWWGVAGDVVDRLHEVQRGIALDIIGQATRLRGDAVRRLALSLSLFVVAGCAEVLLFTRRNPTDAPAALVADIHSWLLGGSTTEECWQLVAHRVIELKLASSIAILRVADDGHTSVVAGDPDLQLPEALAADEPVTIDPRRVVVPLRGRRRVLLAGRSANRKPFSRKDVDRLGALGGQAAVALALAEDQEAMRRRDVHDDRDRIARELYRVAMRPIMGVAIALQGVLDLITQQRAHDRVDESIAELDETLRDIRASIFDLNDEETP